MSPAEATAALRQLAADMRAIADWLIHNWQIDKEYSRRGYELLTAAYVVTYWADGIEAMIKQESAA
jgi:hypothetical protein